MQSKGLSRVFSKTTVLDIKLGIYCVQKNAELIYRMKHDSLKKDSDAGRGWGQEEKGTTEDEMTGWHH